MTAFLDKDNICHIEYDTPGVSIDNYARSIGFIVPSFLTNPIL